MRLREILGYYEELERDGYAADLLPGRCIVFAYTGVALWDQSLFFGDDEKEPTVLYTSGPKVIGNCAESFEKMLYRDVFFDFRLSALRFKSNYSHVEAGSSLAILRHAVRQLGF